MRAFRFPVSYRLVVFNISTAIILMMSANLASGQVLVNFGGDMVTASQTFQSAITTSQTETSLNRDFNGDGTQSGRVITRALNLTTPWLATSANYTGPAFYGGATLFSSTTSGGTFQLATSNVIQNAAGDYLRPVSNLGESAATFRASATLFLFAVNAAKFRTGDSLTHTVGFADSFNNIGRFVVRANGTFYVSSTNGLTSLGTIDPSAINWGLYTNPEGNAISNLSDNLLLRGSSGTVGGLPAFNVLGSTLSNIDYIGFLGVNSVTTGGTANTTPSIGTFNYTAVPEPSSLLLLLGGLGVLLYRRYGRNHQIS